MASFVSYKFRSQKNESRIHFNGSGISIFDLRRRILLANRFGTAKDFSLALYGPQDQEYKDDTTIIPHLSSIIVSRLPAARPGTVRVPFARAGLPLSRSATAELSAASGGGPSYRTDAHEPPIPAAALPITAPTSPYLTSDEAAGISAMFVATEHQWKENQEKMSHAARIPFASPPGCATRAHAPHSQEKDHTVRPTPSGYVCYRCGLKGHWIQYCPTNNDPEFDHRPRIKRTTGIPRTFLKPVGQPTDGSPTAGVMITSEGYYVVAQPDTAAWQKQRTRTRTITDDDIRAKPPNASLTCSLCSRLFQDAVKTSCCAATYCEECIQVHLSEHDFECPGCLSKIPSVDKLISEKAVRTRVQAHIDEALAKLRSASSGGQEQLEQGNDMPTATSQPTNGGVMDDVRAATREQQQLFPEPSEIQARVDEMHAMLNNPALSYKGRAQLQMQLLELTSQLERARMVAALAEATLAIARAYGTNDPSMNIGGMGVGASDYGNALMHQPACDPNEYQPQWANAFPTQFPPDVDSAYQRLPVIKRRGPKRERPSDFLEVAGDGPANKNARCWE